ncbi:ribosomal protein S5 domain 2-type protein [Hygrophoropsis aurantiaca]|uniref:Ribosomal protein S5 domain 2-type protein n=1 Tax=Hygrophoropsis aurantiaca TaxID=72124 RepID=A0ACB8AB53_9AGAM|nr:ribosomal protein S5 domain 2-type protein [Hygrophoropsis aurantiaca]
MATSIPEKPAATVSADEADSLRAQIFQRLHPRTYLERFLTENVRPDGRNFGEWRDVHVNVGSISTADGSALVRMGNTTIVCGVKAEIAEPELDSPDDGFLVPNLDLPAICSPKFKPGPPSEEAQILSDKLNESLIASGLISLSSLCIHPGRAVWTLYVDATCINYDGNVFDAALLAMVTALKNATLPVASFDEESGRVTCSRKNRSSLQLQAARIPFSASFGIVEASRPCVLSDPTSFEEPLLDTTLSVITDARGELISVSELGVDGGTGEQSILAQCIPEAKKRRAQIQKYL